MVSFAGLEQIFVSAVVCSRCRSRSSGSSGSISFSIRIISSIVVAAVNVLSAWVQRFQEEVAASFTSCKIHIPECAVVVRYVVMRVVIPAASTPTGFSRRENS